MKQFLTVLKFELNNYFKNKSFMVTTVLLAVILAGVIIVPTLIPGLLDKFQENDVQTETQQEMTDEEKEKLDSYGLIMRDETMKDLVLFPADWMEFDSEEDMKTAVTAGIIEAGFIVNSPSDIVYVVNNLGLNDSNKMSRFQSVIAEYCKEQYLLNKGLTPAEIREADMANVNIVPEILGKNSVGNYWYTYVLIFVIYFLILFYGQMIAVSVTTEKSNRAIEILVTSVNPNSLIFGKVLAGALAGIIQMVVILGAAFASYQVVGNAWGGILDMLFDIPGKVLISFAVFGILSYLLYAFIFGALGALVSKTEDISKSATPVTIAYVVSFMVAMMGLTNSDSLIVKVASFIPFTSGNAMFIRISMGSVAWWEILVSLVLLAGTCILTGVFAAKLFRFGTLHYGNPVKLTKALKNVRQ